MRERLESRMSLYEDYCRQGLSLDMSRGKPGAEQLDLTMEMLREFDGGADCRTEAGFDVRNYGLLDGIPEAKRLFGELLGVPAERVIVGGNSSLNLMFDYIATAYATGLCGGEPWSKQGVVKFLCPVPGYDRHFAITQYFGIEMISVPMTVEGPDMDLVEQWVRDPLVKGIWCVPMYSNPQGITYSDETVRRFAALKPAAPDFRVMWDNAYCVHHLTDTPDHLLNIFDELRKTGSEDLVVEFASTSKISFPGAGVAAMAASERNIADVKRRMTVQTIGYDKMNMLRHVRYFPDAAAVYAHMKRHAALLRPRFEMVLTTLREQLGELGIASWNEPNGGYFISIDLMPGCAKRTVELLKNVGVVITGAGATYPYGNDPQDRNLRLAPTYPSLEDLSQAIRLFCLCAEIAAIERLLND
ncbi:MAG: aminotransferase [Clostridia bacterium]|nr:aminotransferase [Clostridia bacterium]